MPSFFDNINSKVVDDLKVSIKDGSKLSIASACFSIYAFEELKLQLQNIDEHAEKKGISEKIPARVQKLLHWGSTFLGRQARKRGIGK